MGKKKIRKELVEEDEGKYSSEQNESLRKKFKKNITTNIVHDSSDDELNAITNEKSKPKISSVKEVITNTITNTTEEIVEEAEGKYSSHQNESLRENKKNFKTKMVHDSSDDELSDKTNETSKPKISSIKITKKATTIEMASKIGLILNEIDLLIVEQKKKTGISKNQKSYTLMKTLLTDGIEYIEITEFTTSRLFIYRIGILF